MEKVLANIAQSMEQQLDSEIERLSVLDSDDLDKLRQQRLSEMKKHSQKKQVWLANGHGEYTELSEEKEFFEVSKKSTDFVCHFYKANSPRCKIVDMHLNLLARKHVEARFVKVDVMRCPFLTERLRIKVIPTVALVKDSKTKDFIVGFTDLGNCDDFSTEMLEWRIARAGVIEYNGDLLMPPDQSRMKKPSTKNRRTIRDSGDSDDSDIDFND